MSSGLGRLASACAVDLMTPTVFAVGDHLARLNVIDLDACIIFCPWLLAVLCLRMVTTGMISVVVQT